MAALMISFRNVEFLNACVNCDREQSGRDFESYTFGERVKLAKNALNWFEEEGHRWNLMLNGMLGEYRQEIAKKQKRLMKKWIKQATAVLV